MRRPVKSRPEEFNCLRPPLTVSVSCATGQTVPSHPSQKRSLVVTIFFECFGGGHFLEFLKIAKQTNPTMSYLQITKNVTANKGLAGVIDGFLPWCVCALIQCHLGLLLSLLR